MNAITITITVSLPDGATATVGTGPPAAPVTGYAPVAALTSLEVDDNGWQCPVHHAVKTVPAGVSTRTGKPYPAFLACPERGCDEKPPR